MSITYKFELNSNKKKDKTSSILLRITQGRKLKRASTGVFVFERDFNKSAEYGKWIRRSNRDYVKINNRLEAFLKKVKGVEETLVVKEQSTSSNNIVAMLKGGDQESFINYYDKMISSFETTKSFAYYRGHKSKIGNLKKYLDGQDLSFSELSVTFLNDYEIHLTKQGLNKNSIVSNLKGIRTILYNAIREEKYEGKNPFFIKKIGSIKGNKSKLSFEEIKKIENLKLVKGSPLWHTRNYFLFAFYGGGVRVGDLMQLTWSNIQDNRIGYKMDKTSIGNSTILVSQALNILKHYKAPKQKPEDFIFPILPPQIKTASSRELLNQIGSKNAILNRNLKDIQKLAKIKTKISFHIARHSFADYLRKKGTSIYEIKGLLGHSNIRVTEDYLKSFDLETSDKAMNKAFK